MFVKLTKTVGKPVCVLLYAAFAALAARKKPIPLIALFAMHLTETLAVGLKTAREHSIGTAEAVIQCLAFGFTWWLPIREGK